MIDTEFKLWSETNLQSKENISPKLGLREWSELDESEKIIMLKYFLKYGWFQSEYYNKVYRSISILNYMYKKESYGIRTLNHDGPHFKVQTGRLLDCCQQEALNDFFTIFRESKQDIVFEMLSIYAQELIDKVNLKKIFDSTSKGETTELINLAYKEFDSFMNCFNEICGQFSVNISISRNGFILKQDDKITKEIYEPVLNFLAGKEWEFVSRELKDAFKFYQQKTDQGYSASVTQAISALQAFLQIIVHGKIGKGDIDDLIIKARKDNLIPTDKFTEKIFDNVKSILMTERQATSNAHPKKEYANEKNARLVLNLVMIFLQHCIQN